MSAARSNGLDLTNRGKPLDRFLNRLRGTFLLNRFIGWKVLDEANPNRCCSGHLAQLSIADDGDIVLHLRPPRSAGGETAVEGDWDCASLLNERNQGSLVCELPLRDRPKFDNLEQLSVEREVLEHG
jgi:hypothetical protein